MAEGLSPGDLATLSLLDPHQGVCPSGHRCRLDREPGYRSCAMCDYRGMALICWDITNDSIDRAQRIGADRSVVAWAAAFLDDRGP
jgi:hypothetical protein